MNPIQHPACNDATPPDEVSRVEPGEPTPPAAVEDAPETDFGNPPAERPTPITDAAEVENANGVMVVNSNVARDLERQLAEARARVQRWMDQCSEMGFELIISRDELAEARKQRDRLANACKSAKLCLSGEALPTRHRAILIINAALASME